jgi:hypothetical protein
MRKELAYTIKYETNKGFLQAQYHLPGHAWLSGRDT